MNSKSQIETAYQKWRGSLYNPDCPDCAEQDGDLCQFCIENMEMGIDDFAEFYNG